MNQAFGATPYAWLLHISYIVLQMNGMAMGMPPNGMMSQQGMHGHMLGQQPQAPGLAGMMSPQTASQPVRIPTPLYIARKLASY